MASTASADTPGTGIRVAVLGPVLVEGRAGGFVEPSGALGKSLIVALALARGGALSTAALIDELWGDEPPRQGKAALQTLVSRVRAECAEGLLVSANGGYALAARMSGAGSEGTNLTDLGQAGGLRDAARASVAAADHTSAEEQANTALALWRAEPGIELADGPAADLRARAASLRSELQRIRIESRLHLGQSAAVIGDLESLAAAAPLDEELHHLLMRALTSAGRRNDALSVFAQLRTVLRDELGTSPSATLVRFNAELLQDDAPAAPEETARRVRIGLREAPNHLLGREADLATLESLIRSSRLTTILGPGGLGKTRLAQELARTATDPAVIVVELASVRSGEDVTLALGSTLGIREVSSGSLKLSDPGVRLDVRERILSVLGERATLLVMDNCEHIADAAAAWIADILASTSTVRILATSRSPLAISAESVYPLDSLDSGDEESGLGPAGKLFIERALSARPGVTLPLTTITRLCTRLDGLPLAIELAAARVRSMSVEEIERRLNNRFALLTSGERTAPERHRTLMAVIDWSWNLLNENERALLRRLSRFPDGFSAEAAQIVGSDAGIDVTDALDGLVTQSLVSASENLSTGLMRYRMLETVREFGEMALVDAGEDLAVRSAMTEWAHCFTAALMGSLGSSGQVRTFHLLALEQDNLVAVLRTAVDDGNADAVVTVFASLAYYWAMRGAHTDISGFAGAVLLATRKYTPDAAHLTAAIASYMIVGAAAFMGDRRNAMLARGRLRAVKRRGTASDPRIEMLSKLLLVFTKPPEAMAILAEARESTDNGLAALAALLGAQLEENGGELASATASSHRAYELSLSLGDVWMQSTAAQALANVYSQRGDTEQALHWAEKSREGMNALQASNDLQQLSWVIAMNVLATVPEQARGTFESFVAQSDEDLGPDFADLRSIGWAGLAELALGEGRTEEGLALYRKSVDAFGRETGRMAPWYVITAAACVCAHVLAGSTDWSSYLDTLARRVRTRVLVSSRTRREFMDLPVAGASAVGISAWLLSTAGPNAAAAHAIGLRLLFLGEAMGGRQDMPSLNRGRLTDAAVAAHGATAVDAARASVAGLSPREAFALTCELLRDPTLRPTPRLVE